MIFNHCSHSTRSHKEHLKYKYLGVNDNSVIFQISLGFHMLIGCAQHLNVAVLLLLLHSLPDQSPLHLYATHERACSLAQLVIVLILGQNSSTC